MPNSDARAAIWHIKCPSMLYIIYQVVVMLQLTIREFKIAVYRTNVKLLRHKTARDPSTLHVAVAAHICTCRPLSRHLDFPQQLLRDSRRIYTFGKLILVKLVTSHCDLPFAVCTINGNLKLSIMERIHRFPQQLGNGHFAG